MIKVSAMSQGLVIGCPAFAAPLTCLEAKELQHNKVVTTSFAPQIACKYTRPADYYELCQLLKHDKYTRRLCMS